MQPVMLCSSFLAGYDHRNQGWFTWRCNDFTFSRTEDSVLY